MSSFEGPLLGFRYRSWDLIVKKCSCASHLWVLRHGAACTVHARARNSEIARWLVCRGIVATGLLLLVALPALCQVAGEIEGAI